MNNHTLKGMITFLLLLSFFSCKEEETITNTPPINQQVEVRIYSDQIAQYQTFLKDILVLMISEGINHPEIFGVQSSNNAHTRTGCPCSSTTGAFPSPVTLTLEFGTGGAGCTLQNDYEGSLIFDFNNPLFQQGFDSEFSMSFNNFSINGYDISSTGNILFNYSPANNNYMIFLTEDIAVQKDGITTTYKKQTDAGGGLIDFGTLAVVDQAGDDDANAPATFVNNVFLIAINDGSQVCCTNGTDITNFCISTTADDPLEFQPSTCGCFNDGLLLLRENPNDDCNNTVTSVFYEYDVDANGVDNEACDGYVSVNNVIELFQPDCL